MSDTFIISPLNALDFKEQNNLLPNYANTLVQKLNYEGAVNPRYRQKFLASNTIRTQIYTNFETREAALFDCEGNKTILNVALIKTIAADDLNIAQFWYEFDIAGQVPGTYYVTAKGTKSGAENVYFQCEYFDIIEGVTEYRTTQDGNLAYEHIPFHLLIESSNSESKGPGLYWGDDRISGDPFETSIWVPSSDYNAQPGGERDTYNNLGNETNLQSISQRLTELKTSPIPLYLAMKIHWLSALDYFRINDSQYISPENGENEYLGKYTDPVVTLSLTNSFVIGVNTDDQGAPINEITMGGIEVIVLDDISSTKNGLVTGGYALNLTTMTLTSGSSAVVKIGSTVGGNDVIRDTTITSGDPVAFNGKNYINEADLDASFRLYVTVTGVAVLVQVRFQTIPNSQ